MFTNQKLPENNTFQIQRFPLFPKPADCHFCRKIQRHFDLSFFPFSPRLVLSLHRVSLTDLGVITATTGCVGTAGRREQNGQPFPLRHITPPACTGSWAHPLVRPPFQTLPVHLHVFESFKRKYFDTGEFSGKPLLPFIGFCTPMTRYHRSFLHRVIPLKNSGQLYVNYSSVCI